MTIAFFFKNLFLAPFLSVELFEFAQNIVLCGKTICLYFV